MEELIDKLSLAIPAAFDGDEYRSKMKKLKRNTGSEKLLPFDSKTA